MTRPISSGVGVSFAYGRRYTNGIIHKGVDFSDGREGHDVFSCLNGTVTHAGYGGWGPAYGQHVIVRSVFNGKTKWVLYGHLKTENVSVGETVKAGEKLGTSGGRYGQRYSGNSTGPHLHVQVGYANRYDRYEDPWAVINSSTTPPKPRVKPDDWFGIDMRNLAGFDVVHGAKTIEQRIPAIVADIKTVGREVVCVLELPNGQVANFTKRMAAIGYKRAGGDLGRHIFVKVYAKVYATKMFDLRPRLSGDTKQGVGVIVNPDNTNRVAICTAQLENEDASGNTQVAQARNLVDQFEAFCDDHGIPDSRRFYAVDTNSDNRVRVEVFERAGYVDAFDVAYSSENSTWRSIVRWFGPATKGKRIDLIAVRKTRPVRRARLRTTTSSLSDHLDSFVDIGSL